jgi:hypothetical protein
VDGKGERVVQTALKLPNGKRQLGQGERQGA